VHFEHPAQQVTLEDYLHEVDHMAERIGRLEHSIDGAIRELPVKLRAVIEALQSLRGIAQLSAVSIMAEVGELSRFEHPRQLMGYSGAVSCEHSSGERIRRGAISKAGNAHLRRIAIEAAWAYRHRPALGKTLAARQRHSTAAVTALAWKAQHRLYQRYVHLLSRGKNRQQTITAVGRELLGFIWAIGVHVEREQSAPLPQAA
jgi:transposase